MADCGVDFLERRFRFGLSMPISDALIDVCRDGLLQIRLNFDETILMLNMVCYFSF